MFEKAKQLDALPSHDTLENESGTVLLQNLEKICPHRNLSNWQLMDEEKQDEAIKAVIQKLDIRPD